MAEVTWAQLDVRMRHRSAHSGNGRRERPGGDSGPQGLRGRVLRRSQVRDHRGPLFAPELPGHVERLEVALADSEPAIAADDPECGRRRGRLPARTAGPVPPVIVVDDIPDRAAAEFIPVEIGMDDVSHLQYTSGRRGHPPASRSPIARSART